MPLSAAEQKELGELEAELGAPTLTGLSPEEETELAQLEAELPEPELTKPDPSGIQAAQQLSPTEAVLARAGAEFSRIIPNLKRLAADIKGDPSLAFQASSELKEIDRRVEELGVGQPVSAFGAPLAQAGPAIAAMGVGSLLSGLGLAARIVGGGAVAGVEAGAFSPTESDVAGQAAIGALAGGLLPEAPAMLRTVGGALADVAKPLTDVAGDVVGSAIQKGTVLTSDIFPPDTFLGRTLQKFSERIPVIGTGGVRAAQQKTRIKAVEDFATEFDVDINTQFGSDIIDSLEAGFKKSQTRATRLRREAVGALSREGDVTLAKSISEVDKQIATIQSQGATGNQQLLAKLQDIKGELTGDFSRIAQQRTNIFAEITDIGNRTSPLSSSSDAPLKSIAGAITEELNEFAVQVSKGAKTKELAQAGNKWRQSNRIFSSNFEKAREASFRKLLRGDVKPEAVEAVIRGGRRSELDRLFRNLDSNGKIAARQQILQEALGKAGFPDNINPTKLINVLESPNLKRATNVFFKGRDGEVLSGYKKFLNLTRRAQESSAIFASQGEVGLLTVFLRPLELLTTGVPTGVAARVAESLPMRNLFIRLNKAKAASASAKAVGDQIRALTLGTAGPLSQLEEENNSR